MPGSPSSNLETIQEIAEKVIIDNGGKNPSFERQPIAFGLTALIATFAMDESIETEVFESGLSKIDDVISSEIIDFRRALG